MEVQRLSVSAVSRQSRKGKDLFYFSVVGPIAAMRSLDAKGKMLKERGWRLGWGMERQIRETRDGVGVPAGPQPGMCEPSRASRVW